uniref:Uncharacterized protein n=1 Tax=Rhizophagus irregularis (strain DAOM 181602 / DAOM 197198 / MUCL 43194) TaxID=747089 RepID=U9USW5_RHIID
MISQQDIFPNKHFPESTFFKMIYPDETYPERHYPDMTFFPNQMMKNLPTSATFLYNNTNICEINLKKLDDVKPLYTDIDVFGKKYRYIKISVHYENLYTDINNKM